MSRVTKVIGGKEFGSKTYFGVQEVTTFFDFTKPYALFLVRDEDVIVSFGLDLDCPDFERLQNSFNNLVEYIRDRRPWAKILGRPSESGGFHWEGVRVREADLEFVEVPEV